MGPDTGDLGLRIGLHSGAVTAGVLRGERSRFQLFGDTMNTTARMESTGIRDRIQISQETADLLREAGYTDQNDDGVLGDLPTTVNSVGEVTGATVVDGYTGTTAAVTTIATTKR